VNLSWRLIGGLFAVAWLGLFAGRQSLPMASAQEPTGATRSVANPSSEARIRFATFNVAFNRESAGLLATELTSQGSRPAARVAEVIQRVRPDVILLNEVDYDAAGNAIQGFCENYLAVSQNGQEPLEFPHRFFAPVNTGVDSAVDLNGDGKKGTPDDAFGFGLFPGQYGMVVLSRHPIEGKPRTFQKFLWRDMPDALWPQVSASGKEFYSPEAREIFRLSSKSHWDVPIRIDDRTIHVVAAHPTPPVFDGSEDRNGRRNHDEIRLIADYLSGQDYIYDDEQVRGGLPADASFVVMGDLNADPHDGDSTLRAIEQLTKHPRIDAECVPRSEGGKQASAGDGQINQQHKGDPAADTGDFTDRSVGNLRLDYALPSNDLRVVGCGVFWPARDDPASELSNVSDHHLVWIDIER
jgi:endonuclease/exonuclease/phosphatase family metal-dependent hydrolase